MILFLLFILFPTSIEASEFRARLVFTTDYKKDWVKNRGEVRGAPYIKGTLYCRTKDGQRRIKDFITDGEGYFGFSFGGEGDLFVKVPIDVEGERVGWITKEAKVFQYNPFTQRTFGGEVLLRGAWEGGLWVFSFDEAEGKRRFAKRCLHVLSAIHKVREFLRREVGFEPDQVELRVFEPIEPWTGYRHIEGHIRLAEGDEFSEATIIHEYTHAINAMLYKLPSYFEGVGGEHDLNYERSPRSSWIEAWPPFFIAHILGREWVRLARGSCPQDIENNLWYYGWDGDWKDNSGEVVEGAIASVLWDLSDEANDEGFNGDFAVVWKVLKKRKPLNFREFWESFPGKQAFRKICEANGIVYSRGRIVGIKTKGGIKEIRNEDHLPQRFILKVKALTKEELNVVTMVDEIEGAIIQCKKVPERGGVWEKEWDMEGWVTIGKVGREGWAKGWVECDASGLSPGRYHLAVRVKSKKGYDTLRPIEIIGRDGKVKMTNPILLDHLYKLGTIRVVVFR